MATSKAIPLLLAAALASSLAAQTRARAQGPLSDPLQEPERLIKAQQYAEAEARLKELSDRDARNSQLWFDLGFAQSRQGRAAEAAASYQKAVDLSPKWFEANLNLGLALASAGNFSAAANALQHAVELRPSSGDQKALGKAWLSLGEVLVHSQTDLKPALAAYDKAIELNPDGPAFLASARALERAGDLAGAEQRYQKALLLGENAAMPELANLMVQEKRLPEAEALLNKIAAGDPQNTAAKVQLGRVLAAEGKTQEAIDALQSSAGAAVDPSITRVLAGLYMENKQYDRAAPLLQQLLQKEPDDAQSHSDLGVAQMHLHKYPEAEAELLKSLQLKPDLTEAYYELAYAAQQNKHYELAIRALDARAKLLPETAGTFWIRAVSYDSLRAYKPAIENYKLFLGAAAGKFPDQEFQARHRLKAIEPQ